MKRTISLVAFCISSQVVLGASFSDEFNGPDGPVGNGWSTFDGGASVSNNELATYGYPNRAGGVARPFQLGPGQACVFSFDFHTDAPLDGGWEIRLNSTLPEFISGSNLARFWQGNGADHLIRYGNGTSWGEGILPEHARPIIAIAHISGVLGPDLSAAITIDYGDGGPMDQVSFPSPNIDPASISQGQWLVLGNSNATYGPHYFDNFLVMTGFSDNFNRPNGPVGNGWGTFDGGANVSNNELATYGYPNRAGGVARPFQLDPGQECMFSFDFHTDAPLDGGWEIRLNSTLPEFISGSNLARFWQGNGADHLIRYGNGTSWGEGILPEHARPITATAHISGVLGPDLSAAITIDYGDGGPNDQVSFPSPNIDPASISQGQWLVLGNSNATYGPHYFDNFVAMTGDAQVRRGDTNCDGVVSFADINPFVQALSNLSAWQTAHPTCLWQNCDANADGVVSFADINPFVALLAHGG